MSGVKYDQDKLRWDLLPWEEVEDVVAVLTMGAVKYEENNWQRVRPMKSRYFAAAIRHLMAWLKGEKIDSDSGKPHLAHAVCCLLFLMWGDSQGVTDEE